MVAYALPMLALSASASALVTLAPRSPATPCAFVCPPPPYGEVAWASSLRVPADNVLQCSYTGSTNTLPVDPFKCFYTTTNGLLIHDESAEDCPVEAAREHTPTYGCPASDAWNRPLQFASRSSKSADFVSCIYTEASLCNYSLKTSEPVDKNAGGPCPLLAPARCEHDGFRGGAQYVYHGQDASAAMQRKFLAGIEQQRVVELRRRGLILDQDMVPSAKLIKRDMW